MSQADIIRGLGLPNTRAGQAVAQLLAETDELEQPLGFLSTDELGPNGSNLDRLIAAAPRAEREQIYSRLVAGLASPVRVGNRSMQVSAPPGGAEVLRARLAEARGEAPRSAVPAAPIGPHGGDWMGPTMNWGLANHHERQRDMVVGTGSTVGSVVLGGAAGVALWMGAPVWVPIALGVGAVAAGAYGTYRLFKAVSIW